MPCENCNIQFTVFRRKRTCNECKRFYCSNCLTTLKRNSQIFLCERCAIFSKRPLLRADLLQLKPKDLIFYLQSKHISTTGCVEKDELIKLVLNHIDQTDASGSQQQQQFQQQQQSPSQQTPTQSSPNDPTGNSFDSLRQTCQNFFFNITENISDSLASFDGKTNKSQQDNNNANSQGSMPADRRQRSNSSDARATTTPTAAPHIFDQPRVSRREIPTYASSLNSGATDAPEPETSSTTTTIIINERARNINKPVTSSTRTMNNSRNQSSSDEQKTSTSSSLASPIVSTSSIASQARLPVELHSSELLEPPFNLNVPKLSDCECSDDELFANYAHTRNSLTTATPLPELPSSNQRQTTQNVKQYKLGSVEAQLFANQGDEVSHSSFEELGAVGCSTSVISDDSKGTEDSGGSGNTEAWQLLEPQNNLDTNAVVDEPQHVETPVIQTDPAMVVPPRKKLLRRRSDRPRSSVSEELNSPISTVAAEVVAPLEATTARTGSAENDSVEMHTRRRSGTCRRCGKSNIRRYVEKMRQHLESAQMSEADIKREMSDFLAYLDEQTRSVDFSETETSVSSLSNGPNAASGANVQIVLSPTSRNRPPFFIDFADDNDGIHVYGAEASNYSMEHNPRYVNVQEFDNVEDLESLTVKQLKEVLMLHRVDYKGCCEKQELLDRVKRLWNDLKSSPAVEKLATDELCKICMDAPIDCVILECGHMATCTKCGKVLSECPICRQYIVRVVHTFRA